MRLTVLKKGSSEIPGNSDKFDMAFGETEDYWIPVGLNEDLDEAMKQAVRESIDFLSEQLGIDRKIAYAYLSGAADYEVSQAVDKTKGIHALITKKDFKEFVDFNIKANKKTLPIYIKADGLYVDAKNLFDAMGAEISYNESLKSLTAVYKNTAYTFTLDSNKYKKGTDTKTLAKSPYAENKKFYIPASAVLNVMNVPLNWSTDGNTVIGIVGY